MEEVNNSPDEDLEYYANHCLQAIYKSPFEWQNSNQPAIHQFIKRTNIFQPNIDKTINIDDFIEMILPEITYEKIPQYLPVYDAKNQDELVIIIRGLVRKFTRRDPVDIDIDVEEYKEKMRKKKLANARNTINMFRMLGFKLDMGPVPDQQNEKALSKQSSQSYGDPSISPRRAYNDTSSPRSPRKVTYNQQDYKDQNLLTPSPVKQLQKQSSRYESLQKLKLQRRNSGNEVKLEMDRIFLEKCFSRNPLKKEVMTLFQEVMLYTREEEITAGYTCGNIFAKHQPIKSNELPHYFSAEYVHCFRLSRASLMKVINILRKRAVEKGDFFGKILIDTQLRVAKEFAYNFQEKIYQKGNVIFEEDEEAKSIIVLQKGDIILNKSGVNKNKVTSDYKHSKPVNGLTIHGERFFGNEPLLGSSRRFFKATVNSEYAVCYTATVETLETLTYKYPEIIKYIQKLINSEFNKQKEKLLGLHKQKKFFSSSFQNESFRRMINNPNKNHNLSPEVKKQKEMMEFDDPLKFSTKPKFVPQPTAESQRDFEANSSKVYQKQLFSPSMNALRTQKHQYSVPTHILKILNGRISKYGGKIEVPEFEDKTIADAIRKDFDRYILHQGHTSLNLNEQKIIDQRPLDLEKIRKRETDYLKSRMVISRESIQTTISLQPKRKIMMDSYEQKRKDLVKLLDKKSGSLPDISNFQQPTSGPQSPPLHQGLSHFHPIHKEYGELQQTLQSQLQQSIESKTSYSTPNPKKHELNNSATKMSSFGEGMMPSGGGGDSKLTTTMDPDYSGSKTVRPSIPDYYEVDIRRNTRMEQKLSGIITSNSFGKKDGYLSKTVMTEPDFNISKGFFPIRNKKVVKIKKKAN